MGDNSKIEWTDATWNPTTGCTLVSAGCDHCYAKTLIDTRQSKNPQSVRFGHLFEEVMTHESRLDAPRKWKRPRRIFVNSLSDLFHVDVPDAFIDRVFDAMADAPQHTFQLLTKRAHRMETFVTRRVERDGFVLPHVHLGVSVENAAASWRIHHLLDTPAAVRWVSAEPLLGSLREVSFRGIDWMVVGGESGGRDVRPMHPAWVAEIRDRCFLDDIPFLFKQWGSHTPSTPADATVLVRYEPETTNGAVQMRYSEKHAAGRIFYGKTYDGYPADRRGQIVDVIE